MAGFFSKQRTIAGPEYNRWLIPPALGNAPVSGRTGSVPLFVGMCGILTMYGGGFSTIPAYLAEVFGAKYVSAVHGRLLTAWSAAGVFWPVLVNYIREFQIQRGLPKSDAYNLTMYIMAGLLVLAFLANLAVKAVSAQHLEQQQLRSTPQPRTA